MIKNKPGPAKFITAILLIAGICFFMNSCKKVEVDLGTDFVDNNTTNLALVDTSTVQISTINVDSFPTSNGGVILAGTYKDPKFGVVTSNSYLQIGIPPSVTLPNGAKYDSIEVVLKLNKNYYGDTLSPYKISIHQLTSEILLPNQQYAFYNKNKFSYNPTALGSKSFIISPNFTDTLSIRISDALGQEFFDKLFNKAGEVTDINQFINYFKGLAIVDGGGNNLIVGFKDSISVRLHYLNPGVINTDAYVVFPINSSSYQFNNITADRTGTPIAALSAANNQIFSTQTGNAGFGQYISGAMIKIQFPHLLDILQIPDFVKIIRAQLVLKPVNASFSGYFTLPPSLSLAQTDQFNVPGSSLSGYNAASGALSIQYGNLYIDNLYGTQTAYAYDVTTYLQQQLALLSTNQNGLLLLPPNPAQTLSRIMIGDSQNGNYKSQVNIYYATVK